MIQIDCDAFDPSVCSAVNAPTPGGFLFDKVAQTVRVVITAARITCNAIGALARFPAQRSKAAF